MMTINPVYPQAPASPFLVCPDLLPINHVCCLIRKKNRFLLLELLGIRHRRISRGKTGEREKKLVIASHHPAAAGTGIDKQ